MRILVLDIGGTYIKAGISDENGRLTDFQKVESESTKGGEHLLHRAKNVVREYLGYDCIGVSTTGQVNREDGSILYACDSKPNYSGMRIKDILQEEFGVPVMVENDARCAALGERYFGSGRGRDSFVMLTYGTGIGGATVIDSRLYDGAGLAGEFGFMIIRPMDITGPGYYEKYASTAALVKRSMEIDDENRRTGEIIIEKVKRGDCALCKVFDEWVLDVSTGITTITHVLNPPLIVLGGGIMENDFVVDMIKKKVDELILDSYRPVDIVKASLGNKAGMLGVASLF